MLILRVLQVNNSLLFLSDLIDTDITNCHIVSNAYWGPHDSLPPASSKHHCLHTLCPCKQALKVTGKVTGSYSVLVFCLMYSQSQYYKLYTFLSVDVEILTPWSSQVHRVLPKGVKISISTDRNVDNEFIPGYTIVKNKTFWTQRPT